MDSRRRRISPDRSAEIDSECVRRWRAGDLRAFEELVRRWQQPVARFLSRLLGSSVLVADLCQEVFLRLFQSLEKYREQGTFSTWLYSIALNIGRDAVRRAARERTLPVQPSPATPATDSICERRELSSVIDELLQELPTSQREVVVLRHFVGSSFAEIGRLTDTPESTLKSRFATALNYLRRRLMGLGWSAEDAP